MLLALHERWLRWSVVVVVSAIVVCLTVADLAAVGVALHEALLVGENNQHICFGHQ